jgi:hypothetical protein
MWRDIRKATDGKRTARNTSMAQLFGDERCTAAILDFLRTTDVGVRGQGRRLEAGKDDGQDGGAEWTEDEWSEDEGG